MLAEAATLHHLETQVGNLPIHLVWVVAVLEVRNHHANFLRAAIVDMATVADFHMQRVEVASMHPLVHLAVAVLLTINPKAHLAVGFLAVSSPVAEAAVSAVAVHLGRRPVHPVRLALGHLRSGGRDDSQKDLLLTPIINHTSYICY